MWDYTEKVKDHFFNPRNAGALEDPSAVGEVGSISCGDALRLMLRVEPASEVILDASFQTFGCGSAIASSSALTEMIKGKTLDQALAVSNQEIADYLDGLPPEKMHCSVMGREALQAAIANYRGETWRNDHDEGVLICKCFGIDASLIEDTVRANGLASVQDVINFTKAGGSCAACHEGIEGILDAALAERGEQFNAAPVPAQVAAAPTTKAARLTNLERIRRIERVIEDVRPALQRDHGDLELVDIDDKSVYLSMTGACAGCQMEAVTLAGIQQKLMEELQEFIRVVPTRVGEYARATGA